METDAVLEHVLCIPKMTALFLYMITLLLLRGKVEFYPSFFCDVSDNVMNSL